MHERNLRSRAAEGQKADASKGSGQFGKGRGHVRKPFLRLWQSL
jgi:hypothetical protein